MCAGGGSNGPGLVNAAMARMGSIRTITFDTISFWHLCWDSFGHQLYAWQGIFNCSSW
jgi:hypothetical protein